MKNTVNTSFFKNLKLYKTVYEAGSSISLSDEKHLKLVFRNVGWRILQTIFQNTKETNRIRMMHNFAVAIIKFNKNHGEIITTKYLKACQLAIQKKIAGQPFSSLREIEPNLPLPRLSKSGLPIWIKLSDRASICRGSLTVIRFWLTMFSIYRIFKTGFNPKINTITDPFTGIKSKLDDFNYYLDNYSKKIITNFPIRFDITELAATRLVPIWKASPVSKVSWKGLFTSFMSIRSDSDLKAMFDRYIQLTKSEFLETVFNNLEWSLSHLPFIKRMVAAEEGFQTSVGVKGPLGRLAFKEEAAGKLRVFAMVDVITQSMLKPLHLKLFDLFKLLPNDGTHDQEKAFKYAQSLSMKYKCSYGFDLSAATDRLPAECQARLLTGLFGQDFGQVWLKILVGRKYVVAPNEYNIPVGEYEYSVGQPMGALSSWAMLNLLHHMMVQYCHKMINPTFQGWYDQYVVLGDDIVLFDHDVAQRYLQLCKDLGVTINESKSIISKLPVVEFAKRTSYFGMDVSAFSFKEFISNNNFFGRLSIATKLVNRGIGKNLKKTFLLAQSISRRRKDLSYLHSTIAFLTGKVLKKEMSWTQLISLFNFYENPWSYFGKKLDSVNRKELLKVFSSFLEGKPYLPNTDTLEFQQNKRFSLIAEDNYKVALLLQCKRLYFRIISDNFWINDFQKGVLDMIPTNEDGTRAKYALEGNEAIYLINMLGWFLPDYVEIKVLDFKKFVPRPSPIFHNLSILMSFKLNKYSEWERFFNGMDNMPWVDWIETSYFKKLTFSQLFDLKLSLESTWSDLNFFKGPKDLRKDLIDNPLKVLNFIDETVKNEEVRNKAKEVKSLWLNGSNVPKEVPRTQQKSFLKFGLDKFLKPGFFKTSNHDDFKRK